MICHLEPHKFYANRDYLLKWIDKDVTVLTDGDFANPKHTAELLKQQGIENFVIDISHNPFPESIIQFYSEAVLTNNYEFYIEPRSNFYYFPVFLYMQSQGLDIQANPMLHNVSLEKTQDLMCLNRTPAPHRTWLWDRFNRTGTIDKMVFTFDTFRGDQDYPWPRPLTLPDEINREDKRDIGITHSVYSECAVNLVTETDANTFFISEKTSKPFLACQIPVIVGGKNINYVLQDFGLDMFPDIVPWHEWDKENDLLARLDSIATFVESWVKSGTILDTYLQVRNRVERNKKYFMSQEFRDRVTRQLVRLSSN